MGKLHSIILYLTVAALCFALLIKDLYHRQGNSTVISKSGDFLIEHVPAGGILFPFGGTSFLKFTTTSSPTCSYRTPLFSTQYLDMRVYEDSQTVGVTWVDFQKDMKVFLIAIPDWEDHWINIFISDTPYTVLQN